MRHPSPAERTSATSQTVRPGTVGVRKRGAEVPRASEWVSDRISDPVT
jgi:hypothetical protein